MRARDIYWSGREVCARMNSKTDGMPRIVGIEYVILKMFN